MMRGGAPALAAQLLLWISAPVVSPAQTQLVRTRDVGFATVRYENGLTLGATTLYEGLEARRRNSVTAANGVVSLFNDGRWSMQGFLDGTSWSEPLPAPPVLHSLFTSLRSEVSLGAATTAQSGFMPTLEVIGRTRVHFDHEQHGASVGAAVARAFDGRLWQTTVLGELSGWLRSSGTLFSFRSTPMQLAVGDMLADNEGVVQWSRGSTNFAFTLGVRLGEAQRGTVGWGGVTVTWPLRSDLWTSVSLGSYPADLVQSLPGGRYAAVTIRLPNGKLPPLHLPPPPAPAPPRPPELPYTERLAMVIGFAVDSADLREVRVWAPGVRKVELMGDFVNWVPVPLVKQPNGEWRGYYRVSPGLHRVALRLDGEEIDVPTNLTRVEEDLLGAYGWIFVR